MARKISLRRLSQIALAVCCVLPAFGSVPELPSLSADRFKEGGAMPCSRPDRGLILRSRQMAKAYAQKDSTLTEGVSFTGMPAVTTLSDKQIKFTNIANMPDELVVDIADDGTLSIKPQVSFVHPDYGEVYFCGCDFYSHTFDPQTPVKVVVNPDNSLSIGSWGYFIISGAHKGGYFFKTLNTDLLPANTVATTVDNAKNTLTWPVYIEQQSPERLTMVNFANTGYTVYGELAPDGKMTVSAQKVGAYKVFGDYYCYPAKANYTADTKSNIVANVSETLIEIPKWGIYARTSTSNTLGKYESTSLAFSNGLVTLPSDTPPVLAFEGTGTQQDPYLIKVAADIEALAAIVRSGNDFEGKYFRLAGDITYAPSGAVHLPVGVSATQPFNGVFDGAGHSVKGIILHYGAQPNTGMFGYAGPKSVIKNLNVYPGRIVSAGVSSGGVAGYTSGTVENCHVICANVDFAAESCGGVVGIVEKGTVKGCSFSGKLSGSSSAGGVIGDAKGSVVSGCYSDADVSVSFLSNNLLYRVGGIAGCCAYAGNDFRTTISDCSFTGTVTGGIAKINTGGITGSLQTGTVMERCFNMGNVTSFASGSNGSCGGLTGTISGSTIRNCYTAGPLSVPSKATYVGALAGNLMSPTKVTSGGVITYKDTSVIENCYSTSSLNIDAGTVTEWLVNAMKDENNKIINCWFDEQSAGFLESPWGKPCKFFTSSAGIEGFSNEVWNFSEGLYPILKGFESSEAAKLSSLPLVFADGESALLVKSPVKLTAASGVTWKTTDGKTYSDETDMVRISGGQIMPKDKFGTALIVGLADDGSAYKLYRLNVMPTGLFQGYGTSDDPFIVENVSHLKAIDEAIQKNQFFEGTHFRMSRDIDMSSLTGFPGIGADMNTLHVFNGTFDGDGHAVTGWKYNGVVLDGQGKVNSSASRQAVGLFGVIGAKGTVCNLMLGDDCEIAGGKFVGGIAASNGGVISNCANYATVRAAISNVGGICARMEANGEVIGCYNAGTVSAGDSYAGGIVAQHVTRPVRFCQNDGSVILETIEPLSTKADYRYAGGISATNDGTITGCINNGYVRGGNYVGGISGASKKAISLCINHGIVESTIYGQTKVGSIAGEIADKTNGTFSSCIYDPQVNSFGPVESKAAEGCSPVSTAILVSGNVPEGFGGEEFSFEKDLLPSIGMIAGKPGLQHKRAMWFAIADPSGSRMNLKGGVTLNSASQMKWTLKGTDFSIDGNVLKWKDNVVICTDTLTATSENYAMSFPVRAILDSFKGSGTEADPYVIASADDFIMLAANANVNSRTYEGKVFKVTADLDFTGKTTEAIGSKDCMFNGILNGDNHTVSNLKVTVDGSGIGLFNFIGEKGLVSDLVFDRTSVTGKDRTGSLVGALYGTVKGIVNKGAVESTSNYAGGIAGYVYSSGKILECSNEGIVTVGTIYPSGIAGGTDPGSLIDACVNRGKVVGNHYLAGIVGASKGTVTNCVNYADIVPREGNDGNTTGGIAAEVYGPPSMEKCVNYGNINNPRGFKIGGIAGVIKSDANGGAYSFRNCDNHGNITGKEYLGGIVGYASLNLEMDSCLNEGNITGSANRCGGLVGGAVVSKVNGVNTHIYDSFNRGNVTVEDYGAGGIAGDFNSDMIEIARCGNSGDITARNSRAGGLAGTSKAIFAECYNTGEVTCLSTTGKLAEPGAAGLVALGSAKLNNCYSIGNVSAVDHAGMFIGTYDVAGAEIKNCYFGGTFKTTEGKNISVLGIPSKDNLEMTVDSVVVDKTLNPGLTEERVTFLSTTELCLTGMLGEKYFTQKAAYPVLKQHVNDAVANFSHVFVLGENGVMGKGEEEVIVPLSIGVLPGVEWIASDNLEVDDNIVKPKYDGLATLTKKVGDREYTYSFRVKGFGGIDSMSDDESYVKREYFSLDGICLGSDVPAPGIYLIRYRLGNGKIRTEKVIVR